MEIEDQKVNPAAPRSADEAELADDGLLVPTDPKGLSVRGPLLVSAAIIAIMATMSAWASTKFPPGTNFPVHWDLHGHVNRYGSKYEALSFAPILAAVLTLLLAVIPRFEPRKDHLRRSMKAYSVIWVGVLFVILSIHMAIIAAALGSRFNMTRVTGFVVGVLFVLIGNYLGKIRSNFFAGVRTPWTLSSELSWNKTHHLSGWLWVLFGILMIIFGVVGSPALLIVGLIVFLPAILIVTVIYSYVVWKHDPNRVKK